jgi:hypothetical protein
VNLYHLTAFLLHAAICSGLAMTFTVINAARFRYLLSLAGSYGVLSLSHLGYIAISDTTSADKLALSASFSSSALLVLSYALMQEPKRQVSFSEIANVVGVAGAIIGLVIAVFGQLGMSNLEWCDAFTSLAAAGLLAAGLLKLDMQHSATNGICVSAALCGAWAGIQPLFPIMGTENMLYLWILTMLGVATGGAIAVTALMTMKTDPV